MEQISEADKQVAAIILVIGLCFVFIKVAYEYFLGERFTLFNLLHPVKKITGKERQFIANNVRPFHDLHPEQKRVFLKRFAWFKSKKPFVFYGAIANEEEIKAYVSASAVLMTLGMVNFRFEKSISRIIVYPSSYHSKIKNNHHIGEYNPRLKILVFSAEGLQKGFQIPNDGINLGIHEVAHALTFEMLKKSSYEAKRFRMGLKKLNAVYDSPGFKEELEQSNYLRAYAATSFFEFFAILSENFFESPERLKSHFPKSYFYLSRMLNLLNN
ncbi:MULTISPECIES: zinc-dependent peptidase [Flavobacteriaceae]|uniref:zinc-dependent peptidase n=1 Tax=Flavobacteriaceae TaxID=49546 RepID=UPI001490A8D0|nr:MULTISPECIES: zinc-dependent peptidase [Allomuricauda]MDC6366621.1 zinc-dependent peptidase [Muricauda sp. AC10]